MRIMLTVIRAYVKSLRFISARITFSQLRAYLSVTSGIVSSTLIKSRSAQP